MNEQTILSLIRSDQWMMDILHVVNTLNLPDWWICAGFIRSKIWDSLHLYKNRTPLPDIDVIYFDPTNLRESVEKDLEEQLRILFPDIPWSVKNEARMHIRNGVKPYLSSTDAISKFPETATAIGVKIDDNDQLQLTAPYGFHDVVNLIVKPTPFIVETKEGKRLYEVRRINKNWNVIWPQLKVYSIDELNDEE